MDKDFTDFLLWVYGHGDRVRYVIHLRNGKGCKLDGSTYPMGSYALGLDLDRAYLIKWTPWRKLEVRKPYWKNFYKPLIEFTRSKKVGIVFYQEQCSGQCRVCPDRDGAKCKSLPKIIYPMHISRIHQPSGEMKG